MCVNVCVFVILCVNGDVTMVVNVALNARVIVHAVRV